MAEETKMHSEEEYPPVPVLKRTKKVMTEEQLEALAKGREKRWLKKQETDSKESEEKKEEISEAQVVLSLIHI